MKIYHGTSSRFLDRILRDGIKPRGTSKKGNWDHTIESNPKAVYLTQAYSLYYAWCSVNAKKDEPGLILEINPHKLNPFKLSPDEDFLEQATRQSPDWAHVHTLNKKEKWGSTKWFRDRLESNFTGPDMLWKTSLKGMGNCCYFGIVPVDAITRYAILPDMTQWIEWSDPTITIMNFHILGEYYKALSAAVFGDDIGYQNPEPFKMDDGRIIRGSGTLPPIEEIARRVQIHDMRVETA
jgi:hypothetical protein